MAIHATSVRTIPSAEQEPIAVTRLFAKVSWRILPFLILCYMIAFLDRINIGYAQLQMKQTLTFSDATYGVGAGIFFVGYFLFEVPSNLLLERIGVRKTLLRTVNCRFRYLASWRGVYPDHQRARLPTAEALLDLNAPRASTEAGAVAARKKLAPPG